MDFSHPHFAEPRWLWLAAMGPVLLLVLQAYANRARRLQVAAFAARDLWPVLLRSHSRLRRQIKEGLLVLALAGMGLAMARPQWGEQVRQAQSLSEDILFVLDCSRSMLATDVRPNRLTRAKFAIEDFIQRYGRGRIGLVAFAGQAFLQCPLTFDYDAFRESLLAVDEATIPVPGTDLGRALSEAYAAMEKNDRRKILILLSDGEDLEKSGVKTARALAQNGIQVFAIGVGTPAGTPIQTIDNRGVVDTVRDRNGRVVESRLDEATLRAMAEATGGRYHPLGALGEGMTRIRQIVETTSDSTGLAPARKSGVDRFHLPVAAVIVLMVIESLVGTRRRLGDTRAK
jgi:Ca-activated chloride channel homolog